jgi:hypothetical protein
LDFSCKSAKNAIDYHIAVVVLTSPATLAPGIVSEKIIDNVLFVNILPGKASADCQILSAGQDNIPATLCF